MKMHKITGTWWNFRKKGERWIATGRTGRRIAGLLTLGLAHAKRRRPGPEAVGPEERKAAHASEGEAAHEAQVSGSPAVLLLELEAEDGHGGGAAVQ